jgi:hypothetical protein
MLLALRNEFMQSSSIPQSSVIWDITPCGPLKVIQRFGGTNLYHFQVRRISYTRNQDGRWQALLFPETSVDFQLTAQHYIPEDGNFHVHHCENFKSA